MIKDLLHIELKGIPVEGLSIHFIKKYVAKITSYETFTVNNFSVLLIKAGNLKIESKGIMFNLSSQDVLVIPKNSFFTFLEVEQKLQLFLISFTPEFAFKNCFKRELGDAFYFFMAKPSVKIALDKNDYLVLSLIYKLIYFIYVEVEVKGVEREFQKMSFNLFLFELKLIYTKYTSEIQLNFSRKENLILQFLGTVGVHCKTQHSAKFYAGALFVTPGHLNKIVKQITGKTVKILIVDAIIAEAKMLLEDSQLAITTIADELEFSNSSSFSVFFKRHTSISPSQYRLNTTDRYKK
jgi:AraC family transcriptional activator of pobA